MPQIAMQPDAAELSEALKRTSAMASGSWEVLEQLLEPLIEEYGVDPLLTEIAPSKRDPYVASALAWILGSAERRMTEVFSHEEILGATLQFLLTVGTPAWKQSRARNALENGHWAWFALFDHHPGSSGGGFEDDEHLRLVLRLIEHAPCDNDVLFMIGDGPLAHAAGDKAQLDEITELMKSDPKLALTWRLNEVDWPYGTP